MTHAWNYVHFCACHLGFVLWKSILKSLQNPKLLPELPFLHNEGDFLEERDTLIGPDASESTLNNSVITFHGWGTRLELPFHKTCLAEVCVRHRASREDPKIAGAVMTKHFALPLSFSSSASNEALKCCWSQSCNKKFQSMVFTDFWSFFTEQEGFRAQPKVPT